MFTRTLFTFLSDALFYFYVSWFTLKTLLFMLFIYVLLFGVTYPNYRLCSTLSFLRYLNFYLVIFCRSDLLTPFFFIYLYST